MLRVIYSLLFQLGGVNCFPRGPLKCASVHMPYRGKFQKHYSCMCTPAYLNSPSDCFCLYCNGAAWLIYVVKSWCGQFVQVCSYQQGLLVCFHIWNNKLKNQSNYRPMYPLAGLPPFSIGRTIHSYNQMQTLDFYALNIVGNIYQNLIATINILKPCPDEGSKYCIRRIFCKVFIFANFAN